MPKNTHNLFLWDPDQSRFVCPAHDCNVASSKWPF